MTCALGPRSVHLGADPGEHERDVGGEAAGITREDLQHLAVAAGVTPGRTGGLVDQALEAVAAWPGLAAANGVDAATIDRVAARMPALGTWLLSDAPSGTSLDALPTAPRGPRACGRQADWVRRRYDFG